MFSVTAVSVCVERAKALLGCLPIGRESASQGLSAWGWISPQGVAGQEQARLAWVLPAGGQG